MRPSRAMSKHSANPSPITHPSILANANPFCVVSKQASIFHLNNSVISPLSCPAEKRRFIFVFKSERRNKVGHIALQTTEAARGWEIMLSCGDSDGQRKPDKALFIDSPFSKWLHDDRYIISLYRLIEWRGWKSLQLTLLYTPDE